VRKNVLKNLLFGNDQHDTSINSLILVNDMRLNKDLLTT